METKSIANSTKIRRIIKAVFITVALVLFIVPMLIYHQDIGAAICKSVSVLFGLMGASLCATLARSLVKIVPPSKKLLIIVSVSCVAGFIISALLSGIILHLALAIGAIMVIFAIIVGLIGYVFTYSAAVLVFAGGTAAGALSMISGGDPIAEKLNDSIKQDKSGLKEVAFWHAVSDIEREEREK